MSATYFEFFCPVKILAGEAALEHVPFELGALGASRPLVVTDEGVRKAGLLAPLERALTEGGAGARAIFDGVPPDSSTRVVAACAALYRQERCDSIVAVGGGSVLDTAKGANILVSEGSDELGRFVGTGVLRRPLRPLFAVPTTSGTGSEVTIAAVVADSERPVKLLFASPFLLPTVAVLDPRMTLSLPPSLTAATAMDALTHAIEAFIGRQKNALSDAYATAAIAKISGHLLAVLDRPDDRSRRFELAQAATMAGIAFSSSMTGIVHALGHSLGATAHVHHGVCMSVLLPYGLEHNLSARAEAIGELLLPLAGSETYARTPAADRPGATLRALHTLRDELHERCGLARTISETGKARRDQLPHIARLALDDGALTYNPVSLDYEQALALLERAWG